MPFLTLFWGFASSRFGRTVLISLGTILIIFFGWLWVKNHYYNQGWAAALHAVAVQDQRAIDDANAAKATVKECRNSGRTWDVAGGVCQ